MMFQLWTLDSSTRLTWMPGGGFVVTSASSCYAISSCIPSHIHHRFAMCLGYSLLCAARHGGAVLLAGSFDSELAKTRSERAVIAVRMMVKEEDEENLRMGCWKPINILPCCPFECLGICLKSSRQSFGVKGRCLRSLLLLSPQHASKRGCEKLQGAVCKQIWNQVGRRFFCIREGTSYRMKYLEGLEAAVTF
jgi:hypothetical protein